MATYNKFNQFVQDRNHGVHNFSAHTFKVMLTNTAPVATNTVKANLTEIASGNGYPAGGLTLTVTSSAQVGGVYKIVFDDETLSASGGSIGPFRYAAVYNDTATGKPLVSWFDYGSSVTLGDGEDLLFDFNQDDGFFTDE